MREQEGRPPRRYEIDSTLRRLVVDVGAASSRRHAIPVWFSADLTDVRAELRARGRPSITVYVAGTLGRAVARHPRLHGVRDLRGRVVIFDDVDVNISVEVDVGGQPFPMNHVLRSVQSRALEDLHDEVQAVRANPERSPTTRLRAPVRAYLGLPAPLRSRLLGSVRRFPDRQKALMGTVGLTSVGMYGGGGGLGTGSPLPGRLPRRPRAGASIAVSRRAGTRSPVAARRSGRAPADV